MGLTVKRIIGFEGRWDREMGIVGVLYMSFTTL
jgi:hypothetical protein